MADQEQILEKGKFAVVVDDELRDLIPGYFENRRQDIVLILSALEQGDFELIRTIGHKMKGSGGGYGFDRITEIGRNIEAAAKDSKRQEILDQTNNLQDYLDCVQVVFQS
ncbi:MAG: Hpt domain-containing protein [Deltaproteobacteria bacterium]|nr:Hpt domain-containing protein [Deltaproteobacteria bacterium]